MGMNDFVSGSPSDAARKWEMSAGAVPWRLALLLAEAPLKPQWTLEEPQPAIVEGSVWTTNGCSSAKRNRIIQ
jgi:hypothetical protein